MCGLAGLRGHRRAGPGVGSPREGRTRRTDGAAAARFVAAVVTRGRGGRAARAPRAKAGGRRAGLRSFIAPSRQRGRCSL